MSVFISREITGLKQQVLMLAALVEAGVYKAVAAVAEQNQALAREVIENDGEIDRKEIEIEEECLKIMALHQPVAGDLRYVISCLKINNDLERIGDLAVNIAERAVTLHEHAGGKPPVNFDKMVNKSVAMLRNSLSALIELDLNLAEEIKTMDDEVDTLNRQIHEVILKAIGKKPRHTERYLQYMSVSKQLERIADYATNIAEDVIYMIRGDIVRHREQEYANPNTKV